MNFSFSTNGSKSLADYDEAQRLTPNVSREADKAFLHELQRTDRPRYTRLSDTIRRDAYRKSRENVATQPLAA